MKISKNFVVCLLCIFVFTFKIAAAGIFVDKGLDRAQSISSIEKPGDQATLKDALKHIKLDSSLNLMSHVVANYSEIDGLSFHMPHLNAVQNSSIAIPVNSLFRQAIYKPPKSRLYI